MTAVLRPTASIGYLRNYTFEIRSERAVSPLAGTLDLELYEQGDDKTAYEERPAVRYEEQLFEVPLDESKVAPP